MVLFISIMTSFKCETSVFHHHLFRTESQRFAGTHTPGRPRQPATLLQSVHRGNKYFLHTYDNDKIWNWETMSCENVKKECISVPISSSHFLLGTISDMELNVKKGPAGFSYLLTQRTQMSDVNWIPHRQYGVGPFFQCPFKILQYKKPVYALGK